MLVFLCAKKFGLARVDDGGACIHIVNNPTSQSPISPPAFHELEEFNYYQVENKQGHAILFLSTAAVFP